VIVMAAKVAKTWKGFKLTPRQWMEMCNFFSLPLHLTFLTKMSTSKPAGSSMVEESFEFIDTPSAASPAPESSESGVRTTSVGQFGQWHCTGYVAVLGIKC
jgi:hypothetical protein